MKPVLYRYRDSESVIKHMDGYTPGEGWTPLYGPDEVKAATAAALERAALECDEQAKEPECPERATYCAEAIRALKDES